MNVISLQAIEFGVASGYEIDGVDNTLFHDEKLRDAACSVMRQKLGLTCKAGRSSQPGAVPWR